MVIVLKNKITHYLYLLFIIYLFFINTILNIIIIYFKERKTAQAHFFFT